MVQHSVSAKRDNFGGNPANCVLLEYLKDGGPTIPKLSCVETRDTAAELLRFGEFLAGSTVRIKVSA